MPAQATTPRWANRHALRAQGGAAAAATSTPRSRPRLQGLGIVCMFVLCLQGFSQSAWVAPAVAQNGTELINETFTGASVLDPGFTIHGPTCLTGAPDAPMPPVGKAQIPDCSEHRSGPVPPLGGTGGTDGYLQLTDTKNNQAGDILYDRPLPAIAGIVVEFDQWQYGGDGADGISFFLVDGGTKLEKTGGIGGSLGYAQHNALPGILGGVLGLGLDAFGNYYNDLEKRGTGCTKKPPFPEVRIPNVITLRGPGALTTGYCYLDSTTVNTGPNPPQSNLPGQLRAGTLVAAARRVKITVQPATQPQVGVAVDVNFGSGLHRVLTTSVPRADLPVTYKFGFAGSTGSQNDVHLLRNLAVSTVEQLLPLTLVKQIDRNTLSNSLVEGSSVPYQFVVTNAGPVPITNLKIIDDLLLDDLVCPITTLQPAPHTDSRVVCTGSYTLTSADVSAGVVVNTATATGVVGGQEIISNKSTVSLPLPPLGPPQADLMVTKTNLVKIVTPGTLTTYTLVVTNLGPDAVQGATVHDPRPPGIRDLEWSCTATAGSACLTPSGKGVLNTTVNLADKGSATFVVRAEVEEETTLESLTDTVTVTAPAGVEELNQDNNTASDIDTVVPQADIAVLKEVDIRVPAVGDTVTFTVTVTNNGPSAASGVTIIDRVPTGLTLIRATPSEGTTYNTENGDWVIGKLAFKAQATLTLTAQVVLPGQITNMATKITQIENDPVDGNNSDSAVLTNTPVPVADIEVRKTADALVLPVGNDVTFTVTVTNKGPDTATGIAITDLLPSGLALVSATPSQGPYDATTGVWTIGALAQGSPVTLTLRATVQEAGALTNGAAKTAQVELDPVPGNDVAGVTINGQAADVQVVKTVDRAMPNVGETVTFTVTVTNNGPNAASGVQVLDTLSERLSFVSASPSQGTYDATTGVWRVGTLASAGADATARLRVTATVAQAGPLTNLAVKINQDQPDPNPANDQDSIAPPGQPVADLVVTKSDGLTSVVSGTEVVYTVVVTNRGPSAVTGATVSDPMPLIIHDPTQMLRSFEGLTWTCVASAGSACPAGGTEDLLAVVDLLVGGTATFTIRGRAASVDRGTLVNTVKVTAPPEVMDPLPGNNSATDTDLLTQVADLSITKTDEVESVVPGMIIRYTLVVRNAGPSAVIGALVQDPASVALQGVRWTCVASGRSSCLSEGIGPIATMVNLEPGGTVRFTLIGTVAAEAMGTLANTATVTAPPAVTDPEPGNNTVTDTNAVTPPRHAPSGRKTVSAVALPDLEWRVVWLNPANAEPPLRIRGLDPIPTATTYVDGSVTCVALGVSTVERCDFDAATNEIIYDGIIGPDPGATTEEQAANAVVITFRTTVLPGVTQVANQALAHWDENGNGVVDDDIRAGQVPVQTGIEFRQSDPTVATLPPLACLFQQRLLALTGPAGGGPTDTAPTDGQDPGADAGVDRQSAPGSGGVFTLSTPLNSDTVAGTTVTLAALQVPVSGTVVSQPAVILIANGVSADTLDLVENVGRKTERVPAGAAHDVVTADGVVGEISATALTAADTLRLERVAPTTAPAPLPGVAVSPLVALTLASGRTTFSSPVTLSLPYPDENQDGLVDEMSPALPELTLTAWIFDAASQRWLPLPEARVFTAFNEIRVTTTQTGLYGVFQATDGRTGLAGTSVPAVPGPRSATAQGLGWQDIGVVTTFPFLVPLNTTTLPNGTYALRVVCTTNAADLSAAAGNSPAAASVLRTSGGSGGGGGGCSLRPEGGWSRVTALDAAGNLGVPLVVLLVLGLWVWRRPR